MAREGDAGDRDRHGFYQGLIDELVEFARSELELGIRQADGATLRDHLEKHWRDSGEMPPELAGEPCPDALRYLWGYFVSLSKRRGEQPISHQDVQTWAELRGLALQPFEVEALEQLEEVYQRVHAEALQARMVTR